VANDRAAALAADLAALKAKPTDRGDVITLGDVLFATGRSELQGSADRSIDALSAFLAGHPERLVRIEGFTDSVGSETANQGLSERRASAVASALSRRGVASQRVAIFGSARAAVGAVSGTVRSGDARHVCALANIAPMLTTTVVMRADVTWCGSEQCYCCPAT
jgi:outer membrane protein OmpA-like peptidoglycan-associated protein